MCARCTTRVLAAVVVWGIIALKLAAPVMLLQIGANIAGAIFVYRVAAPAVSEHARSAGGAAAAAVAPRWRSSAWRCSTRSS